MQRRTVRRGVNSIICAVVIVILATFFHGVFAHLFFLTPSSEERLTYGGLFLGGIMGGFGVMITTVGLLRGSAGSVDANVRLAPRLIILGALAFVFVVLLVASLREEGAPRLRPGETITI